jgi:protein-disulfide isomerase
MKKIFLAMLAPLLFVVAAQAADKRGDFEIKPADRVMGNRNAPVVLIEYGAFTCSHCKHFNETVIPALKKSHIDTGKVLYVFRLFPRSLGDAQAEKMARCAPASRYFAIADRIFLDQDKWAFDSKTTRSELVKIGQQMGLAPAAINKCLDSTADDARINAVAEESLNRYTLEGTPHLVINGKRLDSGGVPYPDLVRMLDAAAKAR